MITEYNAITTISNVRELLKSSGFNLTKFASNSNVILKSIPQSKLSPNLVNLDLDEMPVERTLGVLWDPSQDTLKIKAINKDVTETKRGILSFVSSIFDPLGIIAPVVLEPKLIIQELWRRNIDWDTPIPLDLSKKWKAWKEGLNNTEMIKNS